MTKTKKTITVLGIVSLILLIYWHQKPAMVFYKPGEILEVAEFEYETLSQGLRERYRWPFYEWPFSSIQTSLTMKGCLFGFVKVRVTDLPPGVTTSIRYPVAGIHVDDQLIIIKRLEMNVEMMERTRDRIKEEIERREQDKNGRQ